VTWRDELRRVTLADGRQLIGASFRGVPFFVEDSDRAGGRRVVVHEFPLREDPYIEDLGRKARAFRVEGYVVGAGYVQERDELLAALEDTSGPGELVHPYYGVLRAVCTGLATRESRIDGGIARLSIEFIEAPTQSVAPSEQIDLAERVAGSADTAVMAASAEFSASYDTDGLPTFALDSARAALEAATAKLGEVLAPVVQATQELAVLQSQLRALSTEAASLVRQPAEVFDQFRAVLVGLAETAADAPGALVSALVEAYGFDEGPPAPETTATRRRERANQVAITAALRRIIAVEAARLIPQATYASIDEARVARDEVTAMLEEQAAAASDDAYPELVTLRADVVRAVPSDAVSARIVTTERRVSVPSLLLSYQLYGSVEQELDLVARNRVRHPAFVSGELRVLSNG
jgi:prophage DNA circulation protein